MLCLNECVQIKIPNDELATLVLQSFLQNWSCEALVAQQNLLESMILLSVLCINTLNQKKRDIAQKKRTKNIMLTYGGLMQEQNKIWDMESLAQNDWRPLIRSLELPLPISLQ